MQVKTRKRQREKVRPEVLTEHPEGCCCHECVTALNEWVRETAFARAARAWADRDRMVRMAQFPLTQQIEEIEREIALRKNVYPRMVGSGKLRQGEADFHMARIESVLKTLKWMKEHEEAIKAAVKQPETTGAA